MKIVKMWMQFLQECTFLQILYLWILSGLFFASTYYLITLAPKNELIYLDKPLGHGLTDFLNMIYFSFVTLTSASMGYGETVPSGLVKILVIIEIFMGLILFGILISKFMSTRQEKIIEQLYDVSFKEKVDKMRSMLYFYRTHLIRIVDRVKVTSLVRRSDLIKLESSIDGFNSSLNNVRNFLIAENRKSIIKVDDLTLNLLFNSINSSVSKITETLKLFEDKKCLWKKKTILKDLSNFINCIKDLEGIQWKEELKEDTKGILRNLDESLKQLEVQIK
ncbi:MAG: potassium channel family protein [Nanoarchaeota archaeon]|nr:potassium channel family protein [Nanoarchaeota archaeon]